MERRRHRRRRFREPLNWPPHGLIAADEPGYFADVDAAHIACRFERVQRVGGLADRIAAAFGVEGFPATAQCHSAGGLTSLNTEQIQGDLFA